MKCKFCSAELSPGTRFCGSCGSEASQTGQPSPGSGGALSDRQFAPPPTSSSTPPPPRGKKKGIVGKIIASLLILGIVAGVAGWFLFPSEIKGMLGSLRTSVAGSELGKADAKLPDPTSIIKTAQWGDVPANQVMIILQDGLKQKDADRVASALGGKVVGLFEYINLYQIETGTKTETDLKNAITLAKQQPGVELAFPNQQTLSRCENYRHPGVRPRRPRLPGRQRQGLRDGRGAARLEPDQGRQGRYVGRQRGSDR